MPEQDLAVGSTPAAVITQRKAEVSGLPTTGLDEASAGSGAVPLQSGGIGGLDVASAGSGSSSLSFPSDLGQQRMIMSFSKYSFNPGGTGFVNINSGAISLPIPTNLNDDTSLNAAQAELGITGAAVFEAIKALGNGVSARAVGRGFASELGGLIAKADQGISIGTHPSEVSSISSSAMASIKTYARLAGRSILSSVPGAGTAIDAATGTAVNPFATVDFNGVNLKTHSFKWTLAPRNQNETVAISQIIRMLKKNSLPTYSGIGEDVETLKNALLNYPNLVNIKLLGVNNYYEFKPAMIRNISVNYNSGERLNMLEGGNPAVVELGFEAIETSIHTSADY